MVAYTPPTISSITDRVVAMDSATPAISFTIGDAETSAANLTLSGSSDNAALVLPADVVFGGSNGNRTVIVTPEPGQTGVANITITGTGFVAGTTVALGGVPATAVNVVNATTITATTGFGDATGVAFAENLDGMVDLL